MNIFLCTLGGLGDTLMLSMPARRVKTIYPEAVITGSSLGSSLSVLENNPDFSFLKPRSTWADLPIFSQKYDVVIDFRYGVKTFFPTGKKISFDVSIDEVNRRQRMTELDLWVNDIPFYRMKLWMNYLDQLHRDSGSWFNQIGGNWYSLISYLSGLDFTPSDLFIHTSAVENLPLEYVAISVRSPYICPVKVFPYSRLSLIIQHFKKVKFVAIGKQRCVNFDLPNVTQITDLSIHQVAYIIAKSRFLISEEGGLVHVAKAVGKRSLVFFGPTQEYFYGYKDNVNLTGDYPCSPCLHQFPFWDVRCKENHRGIYCQRIESVDTVQVINAIAQLLESEK